MKQERELDPFLKAMLQEIINNYLNEDNKEEAVVDQEIKKGRYVRKNPELSIQTGATAKNIYF